MVLHRIANPGPSGLPGSIPGAGVYISEEQVTSRITNPGPSGLPGSIPSAGVL